MPLNVSKDDSCSLFHRPRPTQAQETSVLPPSQIWSSVRLPRVLARKSRGVCLVGVAGVHSKASPLQGGSVQSTCCEVGSMCIPSIRLQNTEVSEPTHSPTKADSKF